MSINSYIWNKWIYLQQSVNKMKQFPSSMVISWTTSESYFLFVFGNGMLSIKKIPEDSDSGA